jgi:cysteine-rich repeat protein
MDEESAACPDGTYCRKGFNCVPSVTGTGFTCAQASCGNAIIETGEDCDDGDQNSLAPDACRPDCSFPTCGDGILDPGNGEECDDSNTQDQYNCTNACLIPTCGDGIIWDLGQGLETCDDGNQNNYDGCPDDPNGDPPGDCEESVCGDGHINLATEECDCGTDPGVLPFRNCTTINNDVDAEGCRTSCVQSACGDGIIGITEECDDGNMNANQPDRCRLNCMVPVCGDRIVDTGEVCDCGLDPQNLPPGCNAVNNNLAADPCRLDCTLATCGNGVLDPGEFCDDGNNNSGDGCSATCTIE